MQASLSSEESATVIFVTRQASVASSSRAFKAGAVDFLAAPVAEADLLQSVANALQVAADKHAQMQRMKSLQCRLEHLTMREREVMQLVVSGCLNKQVAATLGISEITVKVHCGRVMAKMLADSFADLVRMAMELNLPLSAARHASHPMGQAVPA